MKTSIKRFMKKLPMVVTVLSLSTASMLFTACNDDDDEVIIPDVLPTKNIVETAVSNQDFSTLVSAIQIAELEETLSGDGPFTVFAPTNDAFAKVDPTVLNDILADKELLTKILTYHVVEGNIKSTDLSNTNVSTLYNDEKININIDNGVKLNGTTNVVIADVMASNGIIHAIDEVLLPEGLLPEAITKNITETAASNSDFSTLVSILSMPEMSDLLAAASDPNSDLTVFAPTNTAFSNLLAALNKNSLDEIPTGILKEIVSYHILGTSVMSSELTNGASPETLLTGENVTVDLSNGVKINSSNVIAADVEATNGVIHGIDAVLLPSYVAEALETISEVVMFNNDYTILFEALRKAELLSTISTTNNITVFAPNNDAFANAGIVSLDGLSKEDLTPILLYHVLGTKEMKADLPADGVLTSLNNNEKIYLGYLTNSVLVNGLTTITATDIVKSNGVIHTIDRTLTPPAGDVIDIASAFSTKSSGAEFTVLVSLLTQYPDIITAIKAEDDVTVFAPTDAAFGEITSTLNSLSSAQKQEVLKYHVTDSRAFSTDLSNNQVVTMLNSQDITVNIASNVTITDAANNSDATVTEVNIQGSNGVIHVINKVLIPTL